MTAPATNQTQVANTSTTEAVARLDDLAVGDMKLAKVGERRIVVVRTPSGVHALDNACPHQGYGLATCLLYTSPSPRDKRQSRMPSSA